MACRAWNIHSNSLNGYGSPSRLVTSIMSLRSATGGSVTRSSLGPSSRSELGSEAAINFAEHRFTAVFL